MIELGIMHDRLGQNDIYKKTFNIYFQFLSHPFLSMCRDAKMFLMFILLFIKYKMVS